MISPMLHRCRLAAMICAAIFVIAAQFFAGSALAHAGSHGHSTGAHSSAVQLSDHASTSTFSTVQIAGLGQVDLSLSTPEGGDMPVVPQSRGCSGACCGNGIGCCGAVLAAASNPAPNDRPQQETVSLASDRHSGIDPEALARPPRTLA